MDKINPLIFFDFFQQLRQEDKSLALTQYEDFLKCLFHFQPTDDEVRNKRELLNLCKMLWLTKSANRLKFEEQFKQVMLLLPDIYLKRKEQPIPVPTVPPLPEQKTNTTPSTVPPATTSAKAVVKEQLPKAETKRPITKEEHSEIFLNIQDTDSENGSETKSFVHGSAKSTPFIFSSAKHYPYNPKKVYQAWRRHHGATRLQKTDSINIENTIKNFITNGKYIEGFATEKKRVSRQHLIWLTDQSSSMTPFSEWGEELLKSITKRSSFYQMSNYYFNRYPILQYKGDEVSDFLLFKDKSNRQIQSLNTLVGKWSKNTLVIIFSDGGIAEKRNDSDRVTAFFALYNVVKDKAKIIWFNPASNWNNNTSGGYLSLIFRMSAIDNKSLVAIARDY